MVDFPGSGWLQALNKIAPWVSGSIAAGSGIVGALGVWEIHPFEALAPHWVAATIGVCILATCLFIAQALVALWEWMRQKLSGPTLGRRFSALSPDQQYLLIGVFRTGNRFFGVPELHHIRLEELRDWGYIEAHQQTDYIGRVSNHCEITWHAWQRLEKLGRAGKLHSLSSFASQLSNRESLE